MARYGAAGQHDAGEVDVDDLLPSLDGGVQDRFFAPRLVQAGAGDARRRYAAVKAPQGVEGRGDRCLNAAFLGYIKEGKAHLAIEAVGDALGRGLPGFLVQIGKVKVRPFLSKAFGAGEAEAAGAAGNQNFLSAQAPRAQVLIS